MQTKLQKVASRTANEIRCKILVIFCLLFAKELFAAKELQTELQADMQKKFGVKCW